MVNTGKTGNAWIEKVKNDVKVSEWLINIQASDSTRNSYTIFLKIFCECVGKTPSELISESIKGIKEGLLPAERNEGAYLSRYKDCLKKAGYADKSFYHAISAVKSFYNSFDIVLPKSAGKVKKSLPMKSNQNFLKIADVKKLLINAKSLREKAIVYCMATSGMGIGEIANLKISNITFEKIGQVSGKKDKDGKEIDDRPEIGIIDHRRQKTNVDFVTFISPESVVALRNYWAERELDPETAIKGKDDFAFVTNNNTSKGKQLDPITEAWHFRKLGEKLGYENTETGKGGRKGLVKSRSHSLRKFFATTLTGAGIPEAKVDFLMGHHRTGSQIAYIDHDVDLLKQLYIQFLPFLTFEKNISVVPFEKQLEELKKQNEILQKKVSEAEGMNDKYELLQKQINAMTQAFGMEQRPDGSIGFKAEVKLLPEDHPRHKKGKIAVISTEKFPNSQHFRDYDIKSSE